MGENPNFIVPTAPVGTNNDQAASTAFVLANGGAGAGGITVGAPVTGGTPGLLFYDNDGAVGQTSTSSGGFSVTSIANLAAISPASVSAGDARFVTASGVAGFFVCLKSSIATQVATDPGQGIAVAFSSDPTGASGGWLRQYSNPVNLSWWGFVGDGTDTIDPWGNDGIGPIVGTGTDNGIPLVNFAKWMRGQSAAGIPIQAKLDPGTYYLNGSTFYPDTSSVLNFCNYALVGVTNLVWDAYGVTWQNIYKDNLGGVIASPLGLGAIVNGSGYVPGTYNGVALTGGSGSGATANIVVNASGVVTSVTLVSGGTLYQITNVLSCPNTSLGGSGSGFSIIVNAITGGLTGLIAGLGGTGSGGTGYNSGGSGTFTNVPLTGGSGTGGTANIVVTAGVVTSVTPNNPGSGYGIGNTLSASNTNLGGSGSGFSTTIIAKQGGLDGISSATFPLPARVPMVGYRIQNVVAGTNTFSFVNLADVAASGIAKDMVIGVASEDGQFEGTPPNAQQFELVTVASVVGLIVTIFETFAYNHLTSYVDYRYIAVTGPLNAGAARLWIIDPGGVNGWQGTHEYNDFTVNMPPYFTNTGRYAEISKMYILTRNWTGVGVSETLGCEFIHYNPTFYTPGEIDKSIGRITYNNLRAGAITCQSPFPTMLTVNGGSFGAINGYAKRMLVNGAKMNSTQPTTTYGLCISARFVECEISNLPVTSLGYPTDNTLINSIDEVLVTFNGVAGVITMDMTSLGFNSIHWGLICGQYINLQASTAAGNIFSNDLGTGIVLRNHWLVNTLGTVTGGSGYSAPGTYYNVPLTGGVGSALTANIVVSGGGSVTSVTPIAGLGQIASFGAITPGTGYNGGSAGTFNNVTVTNVNGAGSGATAQVTLGASGVVTQILITGTGAGGQTNPGSGYVVGSTVSIQAGTGGMAGGGSGFNTTIASISNGGFNYNPGLGQLFQNFWTLAAGTGYGSGALHTYTNVPLTGGSGVLATANITVSAGGAVTAVALVATGVFYVVGDVLSASNTNLGGAGSGFSITLTAVTIVANSSVAGDVLSATDASIGGRSGGAPLSVPVGQMLQTVATSLPYSSLPSWATGNMYIFKTNELNFVNCTGNDIIRNASAAYDAGYRYFEYRKYPFSGITGAVLSLNMPSGCQPLEISVNVRQAHGTSSALLVLAFTSIQTPAMVVDTSPGIQATVQIGVAGLRTWTQMSATGINPGAATLDVLKVATVAQPYLPAGRIVGPTGSVTLASGVNFPGNAAVGEVIIKFSAGIVRTPLARQFDDSASVTAAHEFIGQQGLLP